MSSQLCLVCSKSAEFTDGSNLYCGQLCQITGNLTVLMNDRRWNKDVFLKMMEKITRDYEKLQLIDSMLSDASERQRLAILEWMHELDILNGEVLNAGIRYDLVSLLLYYEFPDNRYAIKITELMPIYLRSGYMSLSMFKVLLGKLNNNAMLSRARIVNYLVIVTIKLLGDYVRHLYSFAKFSDWVMQIVDGYLASAELLIANGCDPKIVGEYHASGMIHSLKDASNVFKDPGKRLKTGD